MGGWVSSQRGPCVVMGPIWRELDSLHLGSRDVVLRRRRRRAWLTTARRRNCGGLGGELCSDLDLHLIVLGFGSDSGSRVLRFVRFNSSSSMLKYGYLSIQHDPLLPSLPPSPNSLPPFKVGIWNWHLSIEKNRCQQSPVLHHRRCLSVALLELEEVNYCGTTSFFIKLLLEKKYALTYRVLDATVAHFMRFLEDSRMMPVIWHQSLLAFVQRCHGVDGSTLR
ncbi:hypothetical protein CMV_024638 [Castanea mollissima]|uniref:Uncharacterized protein n=1 Tax=Castanea mollissima TaxID=60419 RepID=A0A8J4VC99_9ROSI|nr:hypothetical protein CMV_024638 [Castanea mollissima]